MDQLADKAFRVRVGGNVQDYYMTTIMTMMRIIIQYKSLTK